MATRLLLRPHKRGGVRFKIVPPDLQLDSYSEIFPTFTSMDDGRGSALRPTAIRLMARSIIIRGIADSLFDRLKIAFPVAHGRKIVPDSRISGNHPHRTHRNAAMLWIPSYTRLLSESGYRLCFARRRPPTRRAAYPEAFGVRVYDSFKRP